jgi:hypothetical protein
MVRLMDESLTSIINRSNNYGKIAGESGGHYWWHHWNKPEAGGTKRLL